MAHFLAKGENDTNALTERQSRQRGVDVHALDDRLFGGPRAASGSFLGEHDGLDRSPTCHIDDQVQGNAAQPCAECRNVAQGM